MFEKSLKELTVSLDFGKTPRPVGRLALRDRRIFFEYDTEFLMSGLEISPFKLPLKRGLIEFQPDPFEGLCGVFNDSLPDGWGRLLFDRYARTQGVLPAEISPLDRLAHTGNYGLGALTYQPDQTIMEKTGQLQLDHLAEQTQEILDGASQAVLAELIALNGSSAGARPKALVGVNNDYTQLIHGHHDLPKDFTPWMVKFSNSQDGADAGAIEYIYALMAKDAGVEMPETHLFSAIKGAGYFATKRFDRDQKKRFHMHTACGLLHTDFRAPTLDYEDLITLTTLLTKDAREVEKIYRLAAFNVLAHNRDDHAKNFSFLMDEMGTWRLSPAYDLTFSSGPGGEQSTMVLGEGRAPTTDHLKKLGKIANISPAKIQQILDQTTDSLSNWRTLAKNYGVAQENISLIANKLQVKL